MYFMFNVEMQWMSKRLQNNTLASYTVLLFVLISSEQ